MGLKRTYIFDEKTQTFRELRQRTGPVPPFKAPFVRTDTIPKVFIDATGKYYDSRSEMERDIAASGYAHVGKDYKANPNDRPGLTEAEWEDTIAEAYNDFKYNGVPEGAADTSKPLYGADDE